MTEPYITPEDIRMRLTNIGAGATIDARLEEWCIEVTDVVNTELGFAFEDYSTEERVVFAYGTPYLFLPPHAFGSVTSVVMGADGAILTDWQELPDGTLRLTSAGAYINSFYPYPYADTLWGIGGYTITADWGYGEVPASVKKVCAELATNTERTKDKGLFTDIIGVEGGGAIRYIGGFTKEQQHILDNIKAKYAGGVVFA